MKINLIKEERVVAKVGDLIIENDGTIVLIAKSAINNKYMGVYLETGKIDSYICGSIKDLLEYYDVTTETDEDGTAKVVDGDSIELRYIN